MRDRRWRAVSLSAFPVAPGEEFSSRDIGVIVYAVAVLEKWIDVYGKKELRRSLMIGRAPALGPLTVVDGFPCPSPMGKVQSVEGDSVWVEDDEDGG